MPTTARKSMMGRKFSLTTVLVATACFSTVGFGKAVTVSKIAANVAAPSEAVDCISGPTGAAFSTAFEKQILNAAAGTLGPSVAQQKSSVATTSAINNSSLAAKPVADMPLDGMGGMLALGSANYFFGSP
ncbi:MAG: hypothetical protein HKL96_09165 [Phycisphaerales bacterium]|nr:hypothetical protein [Phycisphaerales bacterium]